jgi:DNA-binding CsgD family transcriptional regulator
MGLGKTERRGIDDIRDLARTVEPRKGPILDEVLPRLQRLLAAETTTAYRASPAGERSGWTLDFEYGAPAGMKARMVAFLARTPSRRPLYTYDLLSPEPDQRNVVRQPLVELPEREYRAAPFFAQVIEPSIGRDDQLRVLLCAGPNLLAWLGGVRRERFRRRERAILRALIEPLRARLILEQRLLRADLFEKGIAAALDLTAETIVLCTRDGRIAHGSAAARARLDSEPELRARLRSVLAGAHLPGVGRTSLRVAGLPEHFLVSLGVPPGRGGLADRLAIARRAFRLTERQSQVLVRLVQGDANKQIAEHLRCAEATVEVHVTALLRKSGTQSRAALAARFWTTLG